MAQPSPYIAENTIQLDVAHSSSYLEGIANSEIYPGMLVQQEGVATPNTWRHYQHAVAAGFTWTERVFAIENVHEGKTIYDPYQIGDRLMMRVARPGDVFLTKIQGAIGGLQYGTALVPNQYDLPDGWLWIWEVGDVAPVIAVSTERDTDFAANKPRWTAVRMI